MKKFDINKIPKIDLTKGMNVVQIGYLSHDDHTNAFIDIFNKMINDNWELFKKYDRIGIEGDKPLGELSQLLKLKGGVDKLRDVAKDLAKELYLSSNENIIMNFIGFYDKIAMKVGFDEPMFVLMEETI